MLSTSPPNFLTQFQITNFLALSFLLYRLRACYCSAWMFFSPYMRIANSLLHFNQFPSKIWLNHRGLLRPASNHPHSVLSFYRPQVKLAHFLIFISACHRRDLVITPFHDEKNNHCDDENQRLEIKENTEGIWVGHLEKKIIGWQESFRASRIKFIFTLWKIISHTK